MGNNKACSDPETAALLPDLIAGRMASPEHKRDRNRLIAHTKVCPTCRANMLDEANRSLTIPMLKKVSKERGVPLAVVRAALARYARARNQKTG